MNQSSSASKPAVNKWLWIILIIVIVAAGLFAVWYYLMGPGKKVASTTTTTTPATTITTTPSATTPSATADWKTYTNDTYGFSFKYPKDWTIKEATPASYMSEPWKSYNFYVTYTQPNGQDSSGYIAISKKTVDELKTLEPYTNSNITKNPVTFANTPAVKLVSENTNSDTGYKSNGYSYYILKVINTYIISGVTTSNRDISDDIATQKNIEQILSTFQFTK